MRRAAAGTWGATVPADDGAVGRRRLHDGRGRGWTGWSVHLDGYTARSRTQASISPMPDGPRHQLGRFISMVRIRGGESELTPVRPAVTINSFGPRKAVHQPSRENRGGWLHE